jgi:hypothetical protein
MVVAGQKDMQSLVLKKHNVCQHDDVHEIGQDYDKHDNPVILLRCQRCGLLMRETLPSTLPVGS